MTKPVATPTAFSPVPPPWNLTFLDTNFTNLANTVNDWGTYSLTLSDTGAVNAMVVTPPAGVTLTLFTGLTIDVIVANTTTSTTPTLNANGTGVKTIVDSNSNALNVGAMTVGMIARVVYDGTNYRLQTPTPQQVVTTGSFTMTASSGLTTSPTCTVTWMKVFKQVTLSVIPTGFTGTSNSTVFQATGLPATLQPATATQRVPVGPVFIDNGLGPFDGYFVITASSGTIGFGLIQVSGSNLIANESGWTNSGTKSINTALGVTVVYYLN
jgi:hypothetical protein